MTAPPAVPHRELGLTDAEYDGIVARLGREPNAVELAIFSLMWSEHCAYKHSKKVLRTLPTEGPQVAMGPGENAGAVDVGDGLVAAFKVESHNHPSAVEPFQGAATGVGGILRDVFAVGARPIAILDSLRFGELDSARSRYLLERAVAGIGHYGNSIGVATVGGEIAFEPAYEQNCLVNAMCVGLARREDLVRSAATGVGNHVVLLGALTGRDGIGGASVLASAELGPDAMAKRPSVQIGDPFEEKKLLECCLELLDGGAARLAPGPRGGGALLEPLGDGGEGRGGARRPRRPRAAARAGARAVRDHGLRVSGADGCAVVTPSGWPRCGRSARAGRCGPRPSARSRTRGGCACCASGEVVGDVPVEALVDDVPLYDLAPQPPHGPLYVPSGARLDGHETPERILLALLASPNVASKAWAFEQYDAVVGSRTVRRPGEAPGAAWADAAVLALAPDGGTGALAVSIDGNGRRAACDPEAGAAEAVLECAANLACVGAEPLGLTNCLNFGNPEKPWVAWQLERAVHGLGDACRALGGARGRGQRLALQRGPRRADLPHAGRRDGRAPARSRARARDRLAGAPGHVVALLGPLPARPARHGVGEAARRAGGRAARRRPARPGRGDRGRARGGGLGPPRLGARRLLGRDRLRARRVLRRVRASAPGSSSAASPGTRDAALWGEGARRLGGLGRARRRSRRCAPRRPASESACSARWGARRSSPRGALVASTSRCAICAAAYAGGIPELLS